jgi:hypothetical protein
MSSKENSNKLEITKTEKSILLDKYKTAMEKAKFIRDLKNGLGDEIRKNPSGVAILKKIWYQKIISKIKKIFIKL